MAKNSYSEKLLDPRWQQMRLRVFERDKFTCRGCGDKKNTLHAHHPVYSKIADGPWDYEIDEIITLCSACHSSEHEGIEQAKSAALLSLVKAGFWSVSDFNQLCDLFSVLTKDDVDDLFVEKINGTNQNN
jgi:hypothetical protein